MIGTFSNSACFGATAPPVVTIERDVYVPVPTGDVEVSPNLTETFLGSIPSTSFATWAKTVSCGPAHANAADRNDEFAITAQPRYCGFHAGNEFDTPS